MNIFFTEKFMKLFHSLLPFPAPFVLLALLVAPSVLLVILTLAEKSHHPTRYFYYFFPKYFSLVAIPPRICRSERFLSSTSRTFSNNSQSITFNRSLTSLCTVDLEIPKCAAAARTVFPVPIIYLPSLITLSAIQSHITILRF